jgi:beta-galactosidase
MGAAGNGALGTELADEFLLAKPVDVFGLSSFPAWLMGDTREAYFLAHMINLDIIGAASREKPFYQVELQGGAGKPGVLGHVKPDKYDMRVWNWNIVAAGGKGAVYWQYAYEPAGVESPGFGLTGYEHENTERSLEAGRCARYFQEKGLDGATSVQPVNGICISRNASLFLFAAERQEKLYADGLLGVYKVCADAGIPVRFVHTDYMRDAWDEGLRVLYVPMAMALSKEEQEGILGFAKKGGKVVVEGATGFYDERGEMDVRDSLLKEVFDATNFSLVYQGGASYVQTMEVREGTVLGTFDGTRNDVGEMTEGASEAVSGACKDVTCAENTYGKGSVKWIGTHPAMKAMREADPAGTAFVRDAFIPQGYDVLDDLKAEGLIVRMLHKKDEYVLVAVNQHQQERKMTVKAGGRVLETNVPGFDGAMLTFAGGGRECL